MTLVYLVTLLIKFMPMLVVKLLLGNNLIVFMELVFTSA
jgi:hypothetical protein